MPTEARHQNYGALPPLESLLDLYLKQDMSFGEIGERFGVRPKTVYTTMKRRAERAGHPWPLKSKRPNRYVRSGLKRREQHDSVLAVGVQGELEDALERMPGVTLAGIAAQAGVSEWMIYRIKSGATKRIQRTSAERIVAALERLEAVGPGW